MFSLRDVSPLAMTGNLAVLAVGALAFFGLVGLRFRSRGASRFWAAPAALALCLLPLAVAAAFAGLLLRQVLGGMALAGSGGVAAIAAGSAEALLPMLVGLGVAVALTACAFLMTAVGSSRSSVPASSELAGWVLLAVSVASLVFLGAVVWLILSTVALLNGSSADPSTLPTRLGLMLAGGFALVAVTLASALAGPFLAPRGPSGIAMKLGSLASFALCGLLCVAGLWTTWTRSQSLLATAITGVHEGELPEPVAVVDPPEVAPPTLPPPPPAADRPEQREQPDQPEQPDRPGSEPEPVRRTIRESRERAAPRSEEQAVRVGGSIREPKKLRNVSPVYPEEAKQARVQGVVILEATISPRGDVTSVKVLRGVQLLDQSAIDAVKQWVYTPTLLNGVPVPVIMTVTVNYKLALE